MNRKPAKFLALLLGVLLVAAFAWWFSHSGKSLPSLGVEAAILPHPVELKPFSLTDGDGKAFSLERLKGHWTLLFFGYTHCPDICPTTLGILKGVADRLEKTPELARSTATVFISVDPRRDKPAELKQYITYFNPSFIAATGSKEQIDNLAGQVGAFYSFEGDTTRDDYLVNHSATIMLIDPQGRFYARFNAPHTVSGITDAYRHIRAFHDQ